MKIRSLSTLVASFCFTIPQPTNAAPVKPWEMATKLWIMLVTLTSSKEASPLYKSVRPAHESLFSFADFPSTLGAASYHRDISEELSVIDIPFSSDQHRRRTLEGAEAPFMTTIESNERRLQGHDLLEVGDGDYIFTDASRHVDESQGVVAINKAVSNGTVVWSQEIYGTDAALGSRLVPIDNQIFLVMAHVKDPDTENTNIIFTEWTVDEGGMQMYKSLRGVGSYHAKDILRTAERYFAILSMTDGYRQDGDFDIALTLLTEEFKHSWTNLIGGDGKKRAVSLLQNGFSDLFLLSNWFNDTVVGYALTASYTMAGSPRWMNLLGIGDDTKGQSLMISDDQTLLAMGLTYNATQEANDGWLAEWGFGGTFINASTFGTPADDHPLALERTDRGKVALFGDSLAFAYPDSQLFMLLLDTENYQITNQQTTYQPYNHTAVQLIKTTKGQLMTLSDREGAVILMSTPVEGSLFNGFGVNSFVQRSVQNPVIIPLSTTLSTPIVPSIRIHFSSVDVFLTDSNPCDYGGNTTLINILKGSTFEALYGTFETKDGGKVYVGRTSMGNQGSTNVLAIKADANNAVVWQKSLGGYLVEKVNFVYEEKAGLLWFIGYTESIGIALANIMIIQLDGSNGDIRYFNTKGGLGNERGYTMIPTGDGGHLFFSTTTSVGPGIQSLHIFKLDQHKKVVWEKVAGGNQKEAFGDDEGSQGNSAVYKTSFDTFRIAAQTNSSGTAGQEDALFLEIDDDGDLLENFTWGGSGIEKGFLAREGVNRSWRIGGTTDTSGRGGADLFFIEYSPTWQPRLGSTFGTFYEEVFYGFTDTYDGGYVFLFKAGYLLKVDPQQSSMMWSHRYSGEVEGVWYDVREAADQKLSLAGYTSETGGAKNGWIVDIDHLGQTVGDCLETRSISFVRLNITGSTRSSADLSYESVSMQMLITPTEDLLMQVFHTYAPTAHPTVAPSASPSFSPSIAPSIAPSLTPSARPSKGPSLPPTSAPSSPPSPHPTDLPSLPPTPRPTREPTTKPSLLPTNSPSHDPSHNPTIPPTHRPTFSPSLMPTPSPTTLPTHGPTHNLPPQIINKVAPQIFKAGTPLEFALNRTFVDPEGEKLTITATLPSHDGSSVLPSWLHFIPKPDGGVFVGTPQEEDVNFYWILVTAKDPRENENTLHISLQIKSASVESDDTLSTSAPVESEDALSAPVSDPAFPPTLTIIFVVTGSLCCLIIVGISLFYYCKKRKNDLDDSSFSAISLGIKKPRSSFGQGYYDQTKNSPNSPGYTIPKNGAHQGEPSLYPVDSKDKPSLKGTPVNCDSGNTYEAVEVNDEKEEEKREMIEEEENSKKSLTRKLTEELINIGAIHEILPKKDDKSEKLVLISKNLKEISEEDEEEEEEFSYTGNNVEETSTQTMIKHESGTEEDDDYNILNGIISNKDDTTPGKSDVFQD
ncbi:MAG: hypothetical protein AAF335_03810 [Bacteroidota bacterium]